MLPPRVVVDRRASELSNAPVESSVGQRASSERGAKGLQTVNTSVAARHNMVFFKTYDDVTMVFRCGSSGGICLQRRVGLA